GRQRVMGEGRGPIRKLEVLLLEEPTENLDADQVNRLVSVIRGYAKERTCIVISHDLNFVAGVSDRIIVLDKGKVVDQGPHDELVQREGIYKTLYNLKNINPDLLRAGGPTGGPPGPPPGAMAAAPGMKPM